MHSTCPRRRFLALLTVLWVLPLATALHAADPATFTVSAFTFKRPEAWKWVPINSQMRKAQLRVPDAASPAGVAADVVFFDFGPGQGGGVDQNISRWIGQFDQKDGKAAAPIVESATIKGTKVTRVRVDHGTFSSGMPGGPTAPMEDYGFYGAILESPQGDVFIKLTGPAAVVKAAAADFEALVQSPF